jgi:hypothetical protein
MVMIGLYFFPLGEDFVFKYILDSVGGEYWFARAIQYLLFGSLIVAGFLLLRYGPVMLKIYGLVGIVIAGVLVLGLL